VPQHRHHGEIVNWPDGQGILGQMSGFGAQMPFDATA